jgi:hypothetical protein
MTLKLIALAIVGSLSTGSADADTVLYQSIPDLTAATAIALCSSCGGAFQVFDPFSVPPPASSTSNIVSSISFDSITNSTTSFSVEIYKGATGASSNLLFSQTFSPGQYSVAAGSTGAGGSLPTSILTVVPTGLSLKSGDYQISFFSPTNLALPAYPPYPPGTLHTLFTESFPGDPSTSFATSGVILGFSVKGGGSLSATPLPAALPLFAAGLGLVGLLAKRRKRKGFALARAACRYTDANHQPAGLC